MDIDKYPKQESRKRPMVSIVIPNWNGKKFLGECFESLKNIDHPTYHYEIILVDNASDDDSVEFTKQNYPQIQIVQNEKNLGFAEANNIGYQRAKGDYILFLNNDTRVAPDFLATLLEEIGRDEKIGGVQSKILLMDDTSRLDCVGAFLTPTGILYHFGYGKNADDPRYNKKMEIFSMKGAVMLFRREVLDKVGLFDKDFFAYFEETDLCHRIWLAGYKIVYVPRSVIYHKQGGTSLKMSNSFIQFHSFKNRMNSYMKNLDRLELLKILPLHIFLCVVVSIAYPKYFTAIHRAMWWNARHIKKTLQKRRKVQRGIRNVKDKDFIPHLKKSVGLSYYYFLFSGLEKYEDKESC